MKTNSQRFKKGSKVAKKNQLKKPSSKLLIILPKNSNGTSNWDQLSKLIGYHTKPPVMSDKMISESKSSSTRNRVINFRDIKNALPPIQKKSTEPMKLNSGQDVAKMNNGTLTQPAVRLPKLSQQMKDRYVAMDCEMVGTGDKGKESMVARVSLVDGHCNCIYDVYVQPKDVVTDYRTAVSGIKPSHLVNAKDLFTVQKDVLDLLDGKILVGHALKHDLSVLFMSHPRHMIRDTSRYKPFRQLAGNRTPSLKGLTLLFLGVQIQSAEHNSVEDAQAAMQIYLMHKNEWEKDLKSRRKRNQNQPINIGVHK